MKRLPRRLWVAILCAGICVPGSSRAEATPKDPAGAEKLFAEARKLLEAGKYAEACQKLADSHQLDPAVGTLMNLAQCYAKIGKTATAWATYREAVDAAKAAGQTEREKKAAHAAEALEADLSKVTVTVPDAAASKGVEVKRNGMPVPKSLWGVSEPVDPGEYLIEAHTPDGKQWSTRVKVEPGRVAIVVLPPFEQSAAPNPPPSFAAGSSSLPSSAPSTGSGPTNAEHPPATRRIAEYGLLALGVGGLALGTVELVRFTSKNDEIAQTCIADRCPTPEAHAQYLSLHDEATTARTISWVGFAVGAGAVAGSAVLLLTQPSSTARPVAIVPIVDRHEAGLAWMGGW